MPKVLTEEELVLKVNVAVKQMFELQKPLMMEMALYRKDYKNRMNSIIPQVLTNWCLTRYCTVSEQEYSKSHWTGELSGYLLTASRLSLKKNDSYKI